MKVIAIFTLAFVSLAAHGAGRTIQAEHVVIDTERGHSRVEVGRWAQDERGRYRHDIDDWSMAVDPDAGVVWKANSRRGVYSTHRMDPSDRRFPKHPSWGATPKNAVDLGVREINGLDCAGSLVKRTGAELEFWMNRDYGFPLLVKLVVRTSAGLHTTELRDVVELERQEVEGIFKPDKNWRAARGEVRRWSTASIGWPGGPSQRETGVVGPPLEF